MTVPGSPQPGNSYPGNPALSPEVRQRVETTYRQSLELAERGNRQEASLGCDFVLQLDPDYAPARDLLARLESGKPIEAQPAPAAGETAAADQADQPGEPGEPLSRHAEAEALFGGFDDFGDATVDLLDMPELPELSAPDLPGPDHPSAAAPPPTGGGEADLGDRLGELVAARRDGEALELAQSHAERVTADPRLAELADRKSVV